MLRSLLCALVLLLGGPLQAGTSDFVNGEAVTVIDWEALMPPDFAMDGLLESQGDLASLDDLDPQAGRLLDEMMAALRSAPVVPAMDGRMVRLPGFVVPLEGEGQTVTTFFLVPYFGACIHTPPPPSNQIVYVSFEPGTRLENLYDAVWVTGKLRVQDFSHELAAAGYTLEAYRVEPYEL